MYPYVNYKQKLLPRRPAPGMRTGGGRRTWALADAVLDTLAFDAACIALARPISAPCGPPVPYVIDGVRGLSPLPKSYGFGVQGPSPKYNSCGSHWTWVEIRNVVMRGIA